MKQRRRIAETTAGRYRKAGKQEKGVILSEFVELTGFARSYAALVLRNQGRVVQVSRKLRVRGDVGKRLPRRGRGPTYDEQTVKALVQVWRIMDYICGNGWPQSCRRSSSGCCSTMNRVVTSPTSKKLSRMSRHYRSAVTA